MSLRRESKVKEKVVAPIFGCAVEDNKVMARKMLNRCLSVGDGRPAFVWGDERCFVSFDNTRAKEAD